MVRPVKRGRTVTAPVVTQSPIDTGDPLRDLHLHDPVRVKIALLSGVVIALLSGFCQTREAR